MGAVNSHIFRIRVPKVKVHLGPNTVNIENVEHPRNQINQYSRQDVHVNDTDHEQPPRVIFKTRYQVPAEFNTEGFLTRLLHLILITFLQVPVGKTESQRQSPKHQ